MYAVFSLVLPRFFLCHPCLQAFLAPLQFWHEPGHVEEQLSFNPKLWEVQKHRNERIPFEF